MLRNVIICINAIVFCLSYRQIYCMKEKIDLDGKLLIAMPGIGDQNFDKSVIYMCSHSEDGAMGLVINKPSTDLKLSDLFKQLSIIPESILLTETVHIGGPVEHGRGFILHSCDYVAKDSSINVTDKISMTASLEILEDISKGKGPNDYLLSLGYSGWGPGQLEAEIQSNGWLICDTPDNFLFTTNDDEKWDIALKAIGIESGMLSTTGGTA